MHYVFYLNDKWHLNPPPLITLVFYYEDLKVFFILWQQRHAAECMALHLFLPLPVTKDRSPHHTLCIILVFSYEAEGSFWPLRIQGPGCEHIYCINCTNDAQNEHYASK